MASSNDKHVRRAQDQNVSRVTQSRENPGQRARDDAKIKKILDKNDAANVAERGRGK